MKYPASSLWIMAKKFMAEYNAGDRNGICRELVQELQWRFGLGASEVLTRIERLAKKADPRG